MVSFTWSSKNEINTVFEVKVPMKEMVFGRGQKIVSGLLAIYFLDKGCAQVYKLYINIH